MAMTLSDDDVRMFFERLTRIETKMDSVVEASNTTKTEIKEHDKRLDRIEKILFAVGCVAVASGGAAGKALLGI